MRHIVHRCWHIFPSLRQHGFAVEHFPRYVNRSCQLHAVDVVLLSVIIRGRGTHFLGEEIHQEAGGSVSVTHYGQEHDIVTDARGMEIYNVYLDLRRHPLPTLPASLRPVLSSILPIHPRLLHHLNRRVRIRIDEPALLAASLARIAAEMDSLLPGALEVMRQSFQIFLIDVCRAAQRHGFTAAGVDRGDFPRWVEQVRLHLDEEFAAPQNLSSLAKKAGVSVAYLCRLFRNYTGKTIFEYLVERRVHAAMWRLRESREKIISLALACGFNDLAYFNRTFKRIVGATPSAYREGIQSRDTVVSEKRTPE